MTRLAYFLLGLVVGWWLSQMVRQRVQLSANTASVAAQRLQQDVAEAKVQPTGAETDDDLTQIVGIGRVAAQALNDVGIHTFRQLAAQTRDELSRRLPSNWGTRLERDDWIGQAKKLAGT